MCFRSIYTNILLSENWLAFESFGAIINYCSLFIIVALSCGLEVFLSAHIPLSAAT